MSYNYRRLSQGKDENGKRIFIDEHRHVMEQFLRRKLKKNEVVHHKDGNKLNNNIENLQLMTDTEHRRLHAKERKISFETKQRISNKLKHRPRYNKRKITDIELINMVKDYKKGMKLRQVDRKYNLSNGTFGTIIRGQIYYDKKDLINSILNN